MQKTKKFSEDIQGLRALAVLAIIFYHSRLALDFIPGGFLGVDIFFVISGFLITRIIVTQLKNDAFSFTNFYIRRIRRLLPAAFITILIVLLAGLFIYGPNNLSKLGRWALHAQFFSSNFIFWTETGYFNTESQSNALLHFWSLSLEEQFYFFWPLVLFGTYKLAQALKLGSDKFIASVILLISLASLLAAHFVFPTKPSAVFFLLPFRAFEFGIGALVAMMGLHFGKFRDVSFVVGLCLILGSLYFLTKESATPGLLSLPALIGTALCLTSQNSRPGIILRNPITTSIGNASYSLYLAHWPVLAYYTYSHGLDISISEKLGLIVLAFILGYALYYLVEKPLRREGFWAAHWKTMSAIIIGGASIYLSAFTWGHFATGTSKTNYLNLNKDGLVAEIINFRTAAQSRKPQPGRPQVIVIGDSHGRGTANMLNQAGKAYVSHYGTLNACQMAFGSKPPKGMKSNHFKECRRIIKENSQKLKTQDPSAIVVSFRWNERVKPANFSDIIDHLSSLTDAPIYFVGKGAEFSQPISTWTDANRDKIGEVLPSKNFRAFNDKMKSYFEKSEHGFIDKTEMMCGVPPCRYITEEKTYLLYFDSHHLTLHGTKLFSQHLKKCQTEDCRSLREVMTFKR